MRKTESSKQWKRKKEGKGTEIVSEKRTGETEKVRNERQRNNERDR